jgi:molybdopterin-guanine dinucleotide biosynthesis protein A
VSAIILAGGKSQRMGVSKADLRLGKKSLLEWVAFALEGFGELLVVAPEAPKTLPAGAKLVTDEPFDYAQVKPLGFGPLGGLYAGLAAASDEQSFVTGCDTPFLQPRLIAALIGQAQGYDALVPQAGQKKHPLCGVYSKTCLEPLASALASGKRSFISFFAEIAVCFIEVEELRTYDPQLLSFFNLNTPEDIAAAEGKISLLGQGR